MEEGDFLGKLLIHENAFSLKVLAHLADGCRLFVGHDEEVARFERYGRLVVQLHLAVALQGDHQFGEERPLPYHLAKTSIAIFRKVHGVIVAHHEVGGVCAKDITKLLFGCKFREVINDSLLHGGKDTHYYLYFQTSSS